jgi:protein TonB
VRSATVIVSALVHVLVFGYALRVSSQNKRRATTVAVVGEKKKAEEKKKEEKPKAPPKPKVVASARPEPHEAPAPTKMEAPAPSAAPAPVDTGLTMDSSDAPGIAVPTKGAAAAPKGPSGPAPTQQATKAGEKVKKVKANTPSDNPEEDTCTEAPTKPVPVTRPSEIEYTQDARANNVEGRLVLRIVVGADGAVADVVVEKSVDPSLDAAAVAAVKTWTFKPAIRCGKGVAGGIFRLAKTFELGD